MRLGSYQLGNSVREGGGRVDIEDRERILAFVHTAGRQDDGDEVGAGIPQERQR